MAIRNPDFYNLNCSRPYPVDDTASLVDDGSTRLPHHLLADVRLQIPDSAGKFIFIGGLTVSDELATVTFVAAPSPRATTDLVPVAAVTQQNPSKYVHYAVDPIYPGAGGWVVFGTGIEESTMFSYRFSRPAQSLLLPRIAKWYRPLPVSGLGVPNASAPLTGLVKLIGGTDVEIVSECQRIDEHTDVQTGHQCNPLDDEKRNVIVIRLVDTRERGSGRNVFDIYKGCCGGRPESNTCGSPQPIEAIGPVRPDCCGNITVQFVGCAKLSGIEQEIILDDEDEPIAIDEACGVVIDCGLDLDDACPEKYLPDPSGWRKYECSELCVSESL